MLAGSVKVENVTLMLDLPLWECRDCLVCRSKLTSFIRQSFGSEFGIGIATVVCDREMEVRGCVNGKIFGLLKEKVECSP
ncbi:MAG TPA: hypothetical protein VN174_02540 [Candidatus Methanoperedens sp.]|nr:hypothetical protein [Candidatus Methanoperedens sp.]